MANYYIKPTIAEESLEFWIWTDNEDISINGFITIENPKNNKKIKTYKRFLDKNYIEYYNSRPGTSNIVNTESTHYLVINEYYRTILGIPKNENVELNINKASWWDKISLIHWTHPNPTIQFANRATILSAILGIASIILGIIALVLTVYSIYITLNPYKT